MVSQDSLDALDDQFKPDRDSLAGSRHALHGYPPGVARWDGAEIDALLAQERERIAGELHDRVAQVLFSLGLTLSWCIERSDGEVRQALIEARELAARSTEEIRRVVSGLAEARSPGLALRERVAATVAATEAVSGLTVRLVVDGVPRRLPDPVEDALHRVVVEALTNVLRHARARVAVVSLRFAADAMAVTVQDDGVGMPASLLHGDGARVGHFGLSGMERRLGAVGGRLELGPGPEGGLIVRALVPISCPWRPA